ncbi:acyltransferase family protein [Azovibrio restrictus]|uniref:acyltransferase family protein n=1 Tax=Azovibrio restrictus TaxID=146938 RepID=UPI00041F8B92|nr:acyltransferase [Azovibrio restrictus]
MLGTLRLLLALAVAASHVDYRIFGLNPGVMAVIGFYLISGYVMTGLLQRHYPSGQRAPAFYGDRAVRLLPQYLFYAFATLLWFLYFGPGQQNPSLLYFLSRQPGLADLFNNLSIIPLNYYMWLHSDRFTLLPPAWSLGAEIQFYLLAPFILLHRWRLLALGALALGVYGLALGGWIHSDWFGYRLLPGVLLFFFLGSLLQQLHQGGRERTAWLLVLGTCLGALLAGWFASRHGSLQQPYNQETLLGLLLAFPLLQLLATRRRQTWDELAGDISYGVFLNHFLIYWALFPAGVRLEQLPLFLGLSILLAWASQRVVEKPLLRWRQTLRRKAVSA